MDEERMRVFKKVVIILGATIMLLPNGVMWFWGNMAAYVLSYIADRHHSTSGLEAPWITSLFIISWICCLMLSEYISKYIDRRVIIAVGIIASDLASFLSYFAIQKSFMALNFTFGILTGVGTGLLYGNAVKLVMASAKKDVGLLSSILQCSFPAGALISTQLVTLYVNPHNYSPDLEVKKMSFFTQHEIIDRVPFMFLVFGGCSLGMHIIGFIVMQCSTWITCSIPDDIEKSFLTKNENVQDENDSKTLDNDDSCSNETSCETSQDKIVEEESRDYTPLEMLKTWNFYSLWVAYFILDIPFVILTNYYKLFGQIYIHDDHFLTDLGTALIFVSSCSRLIWGVAMDKFGVKNCLVLLLGMLVIVVSWFCYAAKVSRWLYLFIVLLYASCGSSLYSCAMATTALMFGRKHISTNYGLVLTSSVVFNLIGPKLIELSLDKVGWFTTLDIASCLSFFNLILCLLTIPQL